MYLLGHSCNLFGEDFYLVMREPESFVSMIDKLLRLIIIFLIYKLNKNVFFYL